MNAEAGGKSAVAVFRAAQTPRDRGASELREASA